MINTSYWKGDNFSGSEFDPAPLSKEVNNFTIKCGYRKIIQDFSKDDKILINPYHPIVSLYPRIVDGMLHVKYYGTSCISRDLNKALETLFMGGPSTLLCDGKYVSLTTHLESISVPYSNDLVLDIMYDGSIKAYRRNETTLANRVHPGTYIVGRLFESRNAVSLYSVLEKRLIIADIESVNRHDIQLLK